MTKLIPEFAVFDIDGTIATHGTIPESVLKGFKHLQSKNCITTVSTGRGYVRLKEALGEHFDTVVSDRALIIAEHGTKILDKAGNVSFGAYFDEPIIDHIVDFLRSNLELFRLAWFNLDDYSKKIPICCFEEGIVEEEQRKRGHYGEVFYTNVGEFKQRLLSQPITNVTFKLKPHIKVENLKLRFTRTPTDTIFQDGNMEFIKNNMNKAIALSYVADKLGFEVNQALVAGNAINDVEMLGTDAGFRVLVGDPTSRSVVKGYLQAADQIIEVESVEALGNFLLAIGT